MPIILASDELHDLSRGDQEGFFVGRGKAATINTAGVVTFSPEQLLGGLVLRDPNGAARSDKLPSATSMRTHLRAAAATGNFLPAFEFVIRNTADAAETITITQDTGATVTLSGTMTIDQNNSRRFLWVQTGTDTATVYSLGTSIH